jgi:hypothetical protein
MPRGGIAPSVEAVSAAATSWSRTGGQLLEFLEVGGGQLFQPFLAVGGEPDPGEARVAAVAPPFRQPARLGPVDQLDRAPGSHPARPPYPNGGGS